jgi:hypothetical protein
VQINEARRDNHPAGINRLFTYQSASGYCMDFATADSHVSDRVKS